jgi:precorrin-6B methylase 2
MDLTEKTENLNRHPWELSRAHSLLKFIPCNKNWSYADIGAGDRFFSLQLLNATHGKIIAVDNGYKSVKSEESGILCLNDIKLIEDNSIDCLIMMDVLEHVENEDSFLETILAKLKTNGRILVTVPAMQFLFSSHDVFLKHFRRYSRMQLIKVLKRQSVVIERSFYFYSVLFLMRGISLCLESLKRNKAKSAGVGMWRFGVGHFLTRSLCLLLNADFIVNNVVSKIGILLPGLSALAICRKK